LTTNTVSFGSPANTTEKQKIYAFAVTRGGRPQVFDFDITEEGLASLATLVRSEDVLKVVKGCEARFSVESVVSLSANDLELTDRLPMKMSELNGPQAQEA
jgi:hypothetical protein